MALSDDAQKAILSICQRLSDRLATLFLGAGVNAGVESESGQLFPLGDGLAKLICRDLLDEVDLSMPLDEAAEFARYKHGSRVVNDYIFKLFSEFRPGVAHLALAQLPWDLIYTTNYDCLVEQAFSSSAIRPIGKITGVVSHLTDITAFTEDDVPYYKLHGSVELANTVEGRLVLTKEDYRHYLESRKPLFKRLTDDLLSRSFVFVGYSLRDTNFRAIVDDCREVLAAEHLPLSYAIVRSASAMEITFWREKYNIALIAADSVEFLTALKDLWQRDFNVITPLDLRKSREHIRVDDSIRFQKVTDSFYLIRSEDVTGLSDPQRFFRGGEPSWSDIRDEIAPHRDIYYTVFEGIFDELLDAMEPPAAYLITGAAGTGKTTLLHSIAFAIVKEFGLTVLAHIPGTPLDVRSIAPLIESTDRKRVVILIRHAAENVRYLARFLRDAKKDKLPITILLEERYNQWLNAAGTVRDLPAIAEFTLRQLSSEEIIRILDALVKYDSLGVLTGSTREEQINHFTKLADQDLLVALRELTSNGKFDDIIKDEFAKIPSGLAKQAYVYVSALGQIDLPIRYETINRLMNLDWQQLKEKLFRPTEGVLISLEEKGSSRHSAGFRLRARHPVIASIVFAMNASTDEAKLDIIFGILNQLDPGFPEDFRILADIVRGRKLVDTLESPDNRRGVYERLATILPSDPYVLQHRSILERDLDNPDAAIKFARLAVRRSGAPIMYNTLGMALEYAARRTDEPMLRQGYLSEASLIFNAQIRKSPNNPYAHLGLINVKKQYRDQEVDRERRSVLQAEILTLLFDAVEATGESHVIVRELAMQQEAAGDVDDAVSVLRAGLEKKPGDERLCDMLVSVLARRGEFRDAFCAAVNGAKANPTAWRIQRHLARLKVMLKEPIESVKGHYEAAIRHRKGDVTLLVEYGAFLFTLADERWRQIFSDASGLPISSAEKAQERVWWRDKETGKKAVFSGKVHELYAASGRVLAVPENFTASFMRTDAKTSKLRVGEDVKFRVAFSARGAAAVID